MTRCGRRCCGRSSGMSYHCFGSLRAPFEEYQRVTNFISEKQNADGVYGNEKTAKAVVQGTASSVRPLAIVLTHRVSWRTGLESNQLTAVPSVVISTVM